MEHTVWTWGENLTQANKAPTNPSAYHYQHTKPAPLAEEYRQSMGREPHPNQANKAPTRQHSSTPTNKGNPKQGPACKP